MLRMKPSGWTIVASLLALGCGRVSFDLTGDGGITGDGQGQGDGAMVDVPDNAMTIKFGERPTADVTGVTFDTFISNEVGESTLNYGATDELGYVQPTRTALLAARGRGTDYHFNQIVGWKVARDGAVTFHGET